MSSTAHINGVNLVMTYADPLDIPPEIVPWKTEYQLAPLRTSEPVRFAQGLKEALPEVNNLRIVYNEYMFNADGSLHADYEAFLKEAAKQGFTFTHLFGNYTFQQLGAEGESSQEIYDGLSAALPAAVEATQKMIDRMADLGLSDSVYGYELINEPQAFRQGILTAGNSNAAVQDFVGLYAKTIEALGAVVQNGTDSKVLVGGLGYSANFGILERGGAFLDDMTGLDYIRKAIGKDLVWSAHIYGTNYEIRDATSVEDFQKKMTAYLSTLGEDDIIVTELNLPNAEADNYNGGENVFEFYTSSYEWFADNGVGLHWWPGAQTGASHLVSVYDTWLSIRNQGSYAHAMNAFSLEGKDADTGQNQYIVSSFINKPYMASAFGYGGEDTIEGHDDASDFLYGGGGNDILQGYGADNFLFGQDGNDKISVGDGNNHLYGGRGEDTLEGGTGNNFFLGGAQADLFLLDVRGNSFLPDFEVIRDRIEFKNGFTTLDSILSAMQTIDADQDGLHDDVVITYEGATTTLLNVSKADMDQKNLIAFIDTQFDGTDGDDQIYAGYTDADGYVLGNSSDLIYGYAGNDSIMSGRGDDTVYAGIGDDHVYGYVGANVIFGEEGNDALISGRHSSFVHGGVGDDVIFAHTIRSVAHSLVGGDGADVFEIQHTPDTRTFADISIKDFNPVEDTLIIKDTHIDLANLPNGMWAEQQVGHVYIHVEATFHVYLEGLIL